MLHAQKLESLGVLAGGIAHDFNNLLVGVLGNAGLLARRLEPGSDAAQLNGEVILAAERAAELARQMLAYAGKTELVREHVAIWTTLVHEVARLISASIVKTTELSFELDPERPADPRRREPAPAGPDEPDHQRVGGARRSARRGGRPNADGARRSTRRCDTTTLPPAARSTDRS